MVVDTHAHLADAAFAADLEAVLEVAARNVRRLYGPAVDRAAGAV